MGTQDADLVLTCKPGFALITLADCNDCNFVIMIGTIQYSLIQAPVAHADFRSYRKQITDAFAPTTPRYNNFATLVYFLALTVSEYLNLFFG